MKYKIVNGIKYLVDSKGVIMKDGEGKDVVVPEEQASTMTEHKEGDETTPAEGEPTAEAVDELKAYIKTLASSEAKDAIKALDLMGSFSKAGRAEFSKAFGEAMSKGKSTLDVEAIKTGLKSVKGGANRSYEFEFGTKAAVPMSELVSLTGDVIIPDRDTEIIRSPQRAVLIEQLADTGGTNSNKVTWVEVDSEAGTPATTAELVTFAEKEYTYSVYEASVLKVTVMSKHSTEILEDMPALVAAVKEMLTEDLNLKVDEKLFSGAGGADFTGIYTLATPFDAGTLVVVSPNRIDVLRAALVQVATAGLGKFRPTAIMLNPIDAGLMDMTKDDNKAYVMPPFTTADRTVIKGVQIIENTLVPVGEFLVGDFKRLKVRNRRGLTIQVATENGTDFEKDIITMRLSRRLASYVKTNDAGAFVTGDFASAITDLTS